MCQKCVNDLLSGTTESLGDIMKEMDLAIAKEEMVKGMARALTVSAPPVFEVWLSAMQRAGWAPLLAYNYETDAVLMGFGRRDDSPGNGDSPAVLPIAEISLDGLLAEMENYQELRKAHRHGECEDDR